MSLVFLSFSISSSLWLQDTIYLQSSRGWDEACKARRPQEVEVEQQQQHGKLEFSEDEVLMLFEHCGFRVEKHESCAGEAGYIRNRRNMLQNIYRLSHWIARK